MRELLELSASIDDLRDLARRKGISWCFLRPSRSDRTTCCDFSSWNAFAEESAGHPMAEVARQAAGSPPQVPARCDHRATRPRWPAVSWEHRSPPSAVPRTSMTACRTPAWPGSAATADNHPGTASNGCTTCPEAHCRLRRRYRVLQASCVLFLV